MKAVRINVQSVRLDTPASKKLKLRPSVQQAPTQKKVHQCVALAQQVIIVLKERKRPPYVMVEHLQEAVRLCALTVMEVSIAL